MHRGQTCMGEMLPGNARRVRLKSPPDTNPFHPGIAPLFASAPKPKGRQSPCAAFRAYPLASMRASLLLLAAASLLLAGAVGAQNDTADSKVRGLPIGALAGPATRR